MERAKAAGWFGGLLVLGVALGAAPGARSAANGAAGPGNLQSVAITYNLVAKGITVGTGTYSYNFKGDGYTGTATHRLIGFARRIVGKRQDFSYSVSGDVTPDGKLRPRAYRHQGGSRNRIVTVDFGDRAVTTQANPTMGMGQPPATAAQKLNTIDQVTMMAALMVVARDPCNQKQRIFLEGRTRFDLDLNPAGTQNVNLEGYRGPAIRCSVRFQPVAGFTDPMEASTLTFLFAPSNGVFVPVQIQMPTEEAGLVRLEARRVSIVGTR
ncbi:MAG: hypothetical protein RLZZ157_490 [Pseudomonadota bacterium]|jgi:hypothetical protein